MSAIRYMLARFREPDLFDDAVDAVRQAAGVQRWDAVDGHYQMIVKADDGHKLDLDSLQKTFQLSELVDLKVNDDREPAGGVTREDCFSYLLVEIDPKLRERVRVTLGEIEQTFVVNAADGPYDTLVLLKSDTFADINRTIQTKIAPLDGILRFKQCRIISSNPV